MPLASSGACKRPGEEGSANGPADFLCCEPQNSLRMGNLVAANLHRDRSSEFTYAFETVRETHAEPEMYTLPADRGREAQVDSRCAGRDDCNSRHRDLRRPILKPTSSVRAGGIAESKQVGTMCISRRVADVETTG